MFIKRYNYISFISLLLLSGGLVLKAGAQSNEVVSENAAVSETEHASKEELGTQEETEAAEETEPAVADMNRHINLDLRNMDVVDALTYLSLRSGANIVASKAVTGRVTLQIKDVSIQDIFDITLLSNNLAYEKRGKIYYVMTEKEYEGRYGKSFSDIRKVKVFHLQYAIPDKAFDLMDTLKSSVGRILVDQESGTVVIMDTEEKINEIEEALAILEEKNNTNIFNLEYATAKNVEEQLKSQIDNKNLGTVWADERNNQVVVQTLPERMNEIERLITALDKKTKEVLIDAKIVKIKISDELAVGFEWEGMFQKLVSDGFVGTHPLEPVERLNQTFVDDFTRIQPEDSNPSAGSKTVGFQKVFFGKTSPNHSFEVLFNFLQTLGDTRLLSNPKLAVINNQEARIHVGRREAYITTTTTTGQTTTTTAEDVTFVDVGIQLSVTPTINNEGYISMQIKPEVSSVVDILTTPSGNEIPIIDTSLAETTVIVKDGATIIIGGLRREEETDSNKRVPFLGQIPILGHLFGSRTKASDRSELIVMITPHIVSGDILVTGEVEPGETGTKAYKDYENFEISEKEEKENLRFKSYRD